ncbi:hypothetical protein BD309DRAFT_966641, partial [Dichomitus squalens]
MTDAANLPIRLATTPWITLVVCGGISANVSMDDEFFTLASEERQFLYSSSRRRLSSSPINAIL